MHRAVLYALASWTAAVARDDENSVVVKSPRCAARRASVFRPEPKEVCFEEAMPNQRQPKHLATEKLVGFERRAQHVFDAPRFPRRTQSVADLRNLVGPLVLAVAIRSIVGERAVPLADWRSPKKIEFAQPFEVQLENAGLHEIERVVFLRVEINSGDLRFRPGSMKAHCRAAAAAKEIQNALGCIHAWGAQPFSRAACAQISM